jgi:hypothetical protein
VARRAVNPHGCAPASLCPPFFLLRGYPRERISYGSGVPPFFLRRGTPGSELHTGVGRPRSSYGGLPQGANFIREWGAPPPAATPPRAPCVVPPVFPTAGVPHQREARSGAPPLLRRLRRGLPASCPSCCTLRGTPGSAFRTGVGSAPMCGRSAAFTSSVSRRAPCRGRPSPPGASPC